MSLFIDSQYRQLVLGQLGPYRKTSSRGHEIYILSCPVCGDNKRHGGNGANIYKPEGKDYLWYHCYRCGASLSMREFISRVDPALGEQYKQESRDSWREETGLAAVQQTEEPKQTPYAPIKPSALMQLASIDSLPNEHPAKEYILNRQIPKGFHKWLFWADDFATVAQSIRPDGKYESLRSEPRLLIPFFDADFKLMAIQGRSIDPHSKIRYITAKVHDDAPRVYGMHRKLIPDQPRYIVEGPFDSMFLTNCLAGDVPDFAEERDTIVVYDNEPRKRQTVEKMLQAARKGFRVCVWPESIFEKDINDMVLAGRLPIAIQGIIDENTHSGRGAVRAINGWSRC